MHGWRGDELASSLVFTLASGFDISEQSRGSVQVDICARELYVSQIGRYREHVLVYLIVTGRRSFQRSDGPAVAKMPNSAFSPECRVPENAERCGLGLDFSQLADRALGIVRCLLLTSCGRERT